ncbi:hypothetical protein ILUMI_21076 [Ignelater luminosus]|uniref:Uncharacterized protein n=1 Tax=Ignelater luminosus TaxID=2038154 RepID=A0A8K0G481_IGNLU|nr:hypothetical protein ILUMI_21076 [Ignelater luminosus]
MDCIQQLLVDAQWRFLVEEVRFELTSVIIVADEEVVKTVVDEKDESVWGRKGLTWDSKRFYNKTLKKLCNPSIIINLPTPDLLRTDDKTISRDPYLWELNEVTRDFIAKNCTSQNDDADFKNSKIIYNDKTRFYACYALEKEWSGVPSTRSDATGLQKKLKRLETAILVIVWNTILDRFNSTSKKLQQSQIDLSTVVQLYDSLALFLQDMRNKQFSHYEEKAKFLSGVENYYGHDTRRKKIQKLRSDEDESRDGEQRAIPAKFLKDKDGNLLTKEGDIMRRWKEYFFDVLNEECDASLTDPVQITVSEQEPEEHVQ